MAIERTGKETAKFGGGKFGVGRAARQQILRDTSTASSMTRSEKEMTKFGGGKFGVGRASRKQIDRTKI